MAVFAILAAENINDTIHGILDIKIAQKVSQPSLYLHNKNASFDSSVVNSAF